MTQNHSGFINRNAKRLQGLAFLSLIWVSMVKECTFLNLDLKLVSL